MEAGAGAIASAGDIVMRIDTETFVLDEHAWVAPQDLARLEAHLADLSIGSSNTLLLQQKRHELLERVAQAAIARGEPWPQTGLCTLCLQPSHLYECGAPCACAMCRRRDTCNGCHCESCQLQARCSVCKIVVKSYPHGMPPDQAEAAFLDIVEDPDQCAACGLRLCPACDTVPSLLVKGAGTCRMCQHNV